MKTFKLLLASAFLFLITFSSCKKEVDPCENVTCINGGVCHEGTCNCPTGYSGVNCQIVDPCVNVNCQNGGVCNNGTCNCPTSYEGTTCQTPARDKFLGSYSGSETCDSGPWSYNISLSISSNINEIIIGNLYGIGFNVTGTLVSNTTINIPQQALGSYQVSGTATISANFMIVVFTVVDGWQLDTSMATFINM